MAVLCPLSERDWLYYMVFADLAVDAYGGKSWPEAEPYLAAAWRQYGDDTRWCEVSPMLRGVWLRRQAPHAGGKRQTV